MWRYSDGRDTLYEDCIGPSAYNKAQGTPVRVWGVLAKGVISIYILPEKKVMNRWIYASLVRHYFPRWLRGCDLLVQDHEKCLKTDVALEALADIGVERVDHAKYSQDLNSMENGWHLLRERLHDTMPDGLESREQFIPRLRNAVRRVNINHHKTLLGYCSDQKERARDVLLIFDKEGSSNPFKQEVKALPRPAERPTRGIAR